MTDKAINTTTNEVVEDSKNDYPPDDNSQIVDVHFIFLIHGWLGKDKEMGYIETSIRNQVTESSDIDVVTYKPKCNVGKTCSGIVKGAKRLENEIVSFIQDYHQQHNAEKELKASISFVGNSLGGLYARCLIASLPLQIGSSITLVPNIFVTTVSPHLGIASNTYFSYPRWLERTFGKMFRQTGRDLFHVGKQGIVYTMGTSSEYLEALKRFNKRVAYINAFQTDFQVPTATAAFLSSSSTYPHQLIEQSDERYNFDNNDKDENPVVAILQTKPNSEILQNGYCTPYEKKSLKDDIETMSNMLDSLGWDKVFVDLRPLVPTYHKHSKKKKIGEPKPPTQETTENSSTPSSAETMSHQDNNKENGKGKKKAKKMGKKKCTREIWQECVKERTSATSSSSEEVEFLSHELKSYMSKSENVHFPTGHFIITASTKNKSHVKRYARGRPVVDYFVSQLLKDIAYYSDKHNTTEHNCDRTENDS